MNENQVNDYWKTEKERRRREEETKGGRRENKKGKATKKESDCRYMEKVLRRWSKMRLRREEK